jgi:hypothetical protein
VSSVKSSPVLDSLGGKKKKKKKSIVGVADCTVAEAYDPLLLLRWPLRWPWPLWPPP